MAIFCYCRILGQDFEGIIEYKLEYESKTSTISVEDLEKELGTKAITYFKNGNYMETTDSNFMNFQLYRHSDKRIYFKNKTDRDTLRYVSTVSNVKEPFEYTIVKQSDTILGVVCDKLIINDNQGTKIFYYSSKLPLNPKHYENFNLFNKDDIVAIMEAVYLKMELEYPLFNVVMEAKNIDKKKLSSKYFEVPKYVAILELTGGF
ncbi:hypothetical protein [Mangrovimonas aestuarii]|uniref:hypothetical protein n=1 Tax=Mangrovimonas aestuarii TaxID=3018443 RepID=UPI002378C62B|nr:hypothetical protein [Mangrovimonas aestuarii]